MYEALALRMVRCGRDGVRTAKASTSKYSSLFLICESYFQSRVASCTKNLQNLISMGIAVRRSESRQ